MTQYLRLTVIGAAGKADVALPDDIAVRELLPEILDLLDEPPVASAVALTSLVGVPVRADATLADQDVRNGAVVRIVAEDAAPVTPDVAEVTEAVAEAGRERSDRWTAARTALTLAAALGVIATVMTTLVPIHVIALLALYVVVLVGAVVAGRRDARRAGWGLFGFAVGMTPALAMAIDAQWIGHAAPASTGALIWAFVWCGVAAVFGVGWRSRGVYLGAGVAVVAGAVLILAVHLAWSPVITAAVSGIVTAAVIALVPSFALSSTGVTRLDDATADGRVARRADLDRAIDDAFTTQTSLVVALAAPLCVSVLVLAASGGWGLGLACALVVFVFARSRLFPGALARGVLFIAGGLPLVLALLVPGAIPQTWRIAVACACGIALLIAALLPASPAFAARWRSALSFLEALSVIALIPLLLGVLGVYADILGSFS